MSDDRVRRLTFVALRQYVVEDLVQIEEAVLGRLVESGEGVTGFRADLLCAEEDIFIALPFGRSGELCDRLGARVVVQGPLVFLVFEDRPFTLTVIKEEDLVRVALLRRGRDL